MCVCVQIRGFPTIKIFRKGEEPEDYQGGRSRGDIIEKGLDLFSDNAPPPELLEVSTLKFRSWFLFKCTKLLLVGCKFIIIIIIIKCQCTVNVFLRSSMKTS